MEEQKELQEELVCQYKVKGRICGRPLRALGLCQAHYMRQYRTGNLGSLDVGPDRVKRRLTPKEKGIIVGAIDREILSREELAKRYNVGRNTINRIYREAHEYDES